MKQCLKIGKRLVYHKDYISYNRANAHKLKGVYYYETEGKDERNEGERESLVEKNGRNVVIGGVIIAGHVGVGVISYLIGKDIGKFEGKEDVLGSFDTKPLVFMNCYDDYGNIIRRDAIMTEKFYDAFQHPEKVKWYEDGSFDYVDELKED